MVRSVTVLIAVLVLGTCLALRDNPGRPVIGERHRVTTGDIDLSYFVRGTGQPVVLLPSFGRSASDFNELVEQLNQQGFLTLALEPRGVNGSAWSGFNITLHTYADDVASVLAAEEITEPVFLIGHAFGNRVARTFATDYPRLTRALVLLGAGGEHPPVGPVRNAIFKALLSLGTETQLRSAVEYAFFANSNTAPDYWLRGWYPLAGLAQARATASTPFSEWGAGGQSPMRVLQADQDRAAPLPPPAERLDKRYPDRANLVTIEGAGHAMLPEQFERIVAESVAFLQSPLIQSTHVMTH